MESPEMVFTSAAVEDPGSTREIFVLELAASK
jgi:hypothetical protein